MIELLRSRFADFDSSLAAEVLLEKGEAKVSRETLHVDWSRAGCGCRASSEKAFISRARGVKPTGELIQIDGSEHRWFEDWEAHLFFLVFIDDATEPRVLRTSLFDST